MYRSCAIKYAILLALIFFTGPALRAQLVSDSATNTLSNVTTNITGTVTVGTNGAFTLLVISDNALLTNSTHGIVGANATARSNQVQLISPSAQWLMGGNLFVGSNGASSTLVVSNGALVGNGQASLGVANISSTNNTVLVTGAGSVWSNRQSVLVGQNAGFNRVRVSEGGRVFSTTLEIGLSSTFASDNEVTVTGPNSIWNSGSSIVRVGNGSSRNLLRVSNGGNMVGGGLGQVGSSSAASSNMVLVTDAGSRWLVGTNLFVGLQSAVNRLVISNGGAVFTGNGNLGNLSTSDDNLAIVTGPGSLWSTTNNLSVGVAGARNRLIITNGGAVSGSNIVIGFDSASFANRVSVDGGTLQVASPSGAGALDVRRGTNVLNAGLVDVDRLVLTNSQGIFEFKGGTLITRGALITNGSGVILSGSSTNPAVWDVRPGVSDHILAHGVLVGFNSSFNQLLVSGGALLSNGISGFVGSGTGANSNAAVVSGIGSRWHVSGNMGVGIGGAFNRLTVANGGEVSGTSGRVGGALSANSNNVATVTGAGSMWSSATSLIVGDAGPGNELRISDGGAVFSVGDGLIGQNATANANTVLVSDSGSEWRSAEDLYVGASGSFNGLLVSDGAFASGLNGIVGHGTTASNNLAMVTDPGSLWSNTSLTIGFFGQDNQLVVSNRGTVVNDNGLVGYNGPRNHALVTGPGSLWSNRVDLRVGGFPGIESRLVIANGATVFAGGNGVLGDAVAASSNTVLVTDAGSRWLVATNLLVGSNGAFNRLVVSNGAFANSMLATLGAEPTASNNFALVTGGGSAWSNSFALFVGSRSSGNQLVVTNGGSVSCSDISTLGFNQNSDNNLALVTGPGSAWDNAGALRVGVSGSGNRLEVSNGGRVVSGFGLIGSATHGSSNLAVVTGAGSVWSNRFNLFVGGIEKANRLLVNNGGTVFGSNVFVGLTSSSTNNRVEVNGGTLRAATEDGTGVLDVRRGTNVLNAGLMEVDNLMLTNKGAIPVFSTFANNGLITIPIFGGATPYPSTITVQGFVGVATKVVVTLSNLTHPRPDDLDILLVGPAGQKVMLMSDAGGTTAITNVSLTFDADAAATLPDSFGIGPGIYRPVDYQPGETMPAPAPAGPYSADLASFNGSSPNGLWSLYVVDANPLSAFNGAILGWTLRIETDQGPFVDSGTFEFNGGTLVTHGAVIDNRMPFVVGGPGGVPAVWELRAGAGVHAVARDVIVGAAAFTNNLLHVIGGTLNARTLDIRGGAIRLDAGLVAVDQLIATNTRGHFEFNGGTLRTSGTSITNGRIFTVGGGANPAALQLLGGAHTFANNLTVATNGSLIGNGTVDGTVTVSPGGRLTPGAPIGRIGVLGSIILQGAVNLQIDKTGGVRTNDQVTASGAIFYAGSLNVTDIGADVLAVGDRFSLFSATPYIGGFTTISLPPLGPGLTWTNKLSADGSIEVVAAPQSQPSFASISRAGTNIVLVVTNGTPNAICTVLAATDVTQPLSNWVSIATSQFDSNGRFSFTNGIVPGIPQRFFCLRAP